MLGTELQSVQAMSFMELKELGLPDRVLAMGWCGDSICLGFHRECTHALPGIAAVYCLSPTMTWLLAL